jgi:hypothetical protein
MPGDSRSSPRRARGRVLGEDRAHQVGHVAERFAASWREALRDVELVRQTLDGVSTRSAAGSRRIRWTCIVAVVAALSSCDRGRSDASGQPVASEPSKAGAPASGSAAPTGWDHVAALARPLVPPGKSEHLVAAMAIAARNDDAWSTLRFKHPHPPLAEFPEAAAAVADLQAWARDKGGLVPAATPLPDPTVFKLFVLGGVATETATAASHASLDATAYLGYRLLAEGRNMLEGMLGTSLLQDAIRQAHALGVPVQGWQVPADHVLVRILAGDALYVRYTLSPEGKAEIEARNAKLTGAEKALVESAAGLERYSETLEKLWLVALGDAPSSDTDRAIVARVKQAGAGDAVWDPVSRGVEELARNLERVRTAAAEPSETLPR